MTNKPEFQNPAQPKPFDTLDMDADSGESITPIGTAKRSSDASSRSQGEPSMSSEELARRAKEYYDEASVWVRENQKAVLIAVGGVAAFGLLFYWLGDRFRGRSSDSSFDRVA
jgi:hypothetical protein